MFWVKYLVCIIALNIVRIHKKIDSGESVVLTVN